MNAKIQQLLEDALVLSEKDRAKLASMLMDSLDVEAEQRLQKEWEAELERRAEELETSEVKGIPWADVRKRLWEGLGSHAAD